MAKIKLVDLKAFDSELLKELTDEEANKLSGGADTYKNIAGIDGGGSGGSVAGPGSFTPVGRTPGIRR